MNLAVRGVAALVLVTLGASAAWARPRVQVAPFQTARGDEALAYFGPELARALGQALETGGIEVGKNGEIPITGRVDELPGERVRLTAQARGKTVTAEGPLEAIDTVAEELAGKLLPILGDGKPRKDAPKVAAAVKEKPDSAPEAPKPEAAKPEPPKPEAPKPEPPKPEPPKPEPPKPELAPAPEPPKPEPPPIARPNEAEPPPPRPTYGAPPWGYARGRVVAHAIADIPHAYPGTGSAATQALYYFLRLRLRLAVVPTGIGMAPPHVAAEEGWRAGARGVVMARLQNVEYLPAPGGTAVRIRLEVAVIRDGRLVLRRAIDSGPTDPGPPGLRRGREVDPIYQAVTQSLEAIHGDLSRAFAEIR